MKIESSDQTIRGLLTSGYYKIPRFQRPYSWEQDNIQDFWNDVIRDSETDYFIGSMVVYKDAQQRLCVVDGQQRLTTITILLCALRKAFATIKENELAQGIHGLVERRNIDNSLEFVLQTESSYPYFQDRIQKFEASSLDTKPLVEEEKLDAAYKQLCELIDQSLAVINKVPGLNKIAKQDRARKSLLKVRDAVLNLKVILVKLDDEDDAYVIFETLNTRGKDLALSDLVKSHLTKHLKSKNPATDQVKIKWQGIIETIQGSAVDLDTDTFIHHYWLSKHEYLSAKTLFKTIKKAVTKPEAQTFLDALVKDSKFYRTINDPSYSKWTKEERRSRDALTALALFRVRQQIPCVLSLYRSYEAKKINKKHLETALVAIEKFHFLFTAITSQRSSGGISSMYSALGQRLAEAKNAADAQPVIQDLVRKLRERLPQKDEVLALFPGIIFTNEVTKQKKLVKYVLSEMSKPSDTAAAIDYDSMTIEHLVPQSRIGKDGYDESTIGQIGNLILVPEKLNLDLGNRSFIEKKKILKEAGYRLPKKISAATDWTPELIKKYTHELAGLAYTKVWSF